MEIETRMIRDALWEVGSALSDQRGKELFADEFEVLRRMEVICLNNLEELDSRLKTEKNPFEFDQLLLDYKYYHVNLKVIKGWDFYGNFWRG